MSKSKCQIKPKGLNVKRRGGDKHRHYDAVLGLQSGFEKPHLWGLIRQVAHEFQAEINMNSLFEQGENVASCQGLGARNWGVGARDWRLEAARMMLRNRHSSQ
jgi:hypothetical protein